MPNERFAMALIATAFALLALGALIVLGDKMARVFAISAALLGCLSQYRLQAPGKAGQAQAIALAGFYLAAVALFRYAVS